MAEAVTAKRQKSYFATNNINRYILDDEESFIEHKQLDEGLFQEYQDLTSKIKLDRSGENTELDIRPGVQRRFLLENLVVGWNMLDENDKPVPFTPKKLAQLPPNIIQGLIDDIYKKNSVLSGTAEEDSEGKTKTK